MCHHYLLLCIVTFVDCFLCITVLWTKFSFGDHCARLHHLQHILCCLLLLVNEEVECWAYCKSSCNTWNTRWLPTSNSVCEVNLFSKQRGVKCVHKVANRYDNWSIFAERQYIYTHTHKLSIVFSISICVEIITTKCELWVLQPELLCKTGYFCQTHAGKHKCILQRFCT